MGRDYFYAAGRVFESYRGRAVALRGLLPDRCSSQCTKSCPVHLSGLTVGSGQPAVQNLFLAARALGLGTTLTTVHRLREAEVEAVRDIADDVQTWAMIPVGCPTGRWARPAAVRSRRSPTGTLAGDAGCLSPISPRSARFDARWRRVCYPGR